jgi:hypothetical protein
MFLGWSGVHEYRMDKREIEEKLLKPEDRKRSVLKVSILGAFILTALLVIRFSPLKGFLTNELVSDFLKATGFWAPLAFVLTYIIGVCLFVPGTLLTTIGAAIFGPYPGFLYVWLGAMAGSSAAFLLGEPSAGSLLLPSLAIDSGNMMMELKERVLPPCFISA